MSLAAVETIHYRKPFLPFSAPEVIYIFQEKRRVAFEKQFRESGGISQSCLLLFITIHMTLPWN